MATHTKKKKTIEQLEKELGDIKAEEKRFALEVLVEESARTLRDLVLKRLDEVVTLDDILEAFINKKKRRDVSVWATTED